MINFLVPKRTGCLVIVEHKIGRPHWCELVWTNKTMLLGLTICLESNKRRTLTFSVIEKPESMEYLLDYPITDWSTNTLLLVLFLALAQKHVCGLSHMHKSCMPAFQNAVDVMQKIYSKKSV